MRGAWPLLLLLAPAGVSAGERGPLDAFTQQEALDDLVTDLLPHVEQAAGRPFLRRPDVVLASPALLSDVLFREQVHLLGQLSNLDELQAQVAAQATASSISSAFVGKYGFLDKRLYVVSDGVLYALASRGLPLELAEPVLTVVLAHELAHALQDQHADLGAVVSGRPDGDAVMAVNCVVEGHAVWVHERVGSLLGYDAAVALVADIHGYAPSLPDLARETERFYTSYVYGQGRAFVAWHAEHHGEDAVWGLLTAPPAESAMILAPETYAPVAGSGVEPEVRTAARRARTLLGRRGWVTTDERVGDFDLREQLIERCGDDRLADLFRAGWRSRATAGSPMLGLELQVLAFQSPRAARSYVDRMRYNAQQQLEALLPPMTSAMTGGVSGSITPFEALESDVSAREEIVLEVGGQRQKLGTLWVARGPHVLQVVTVNHRVPDRKMARALRRVFQALDAG